MRAPQLTHPRLQLRRRPGSGSTAAAANDPPAPPARLAITRHPRSAPTGATPPPRPRPRSPRAPSSTAITALYRCSTTDNATNANPGLPRRPQRTEEPITASGVKHVLGLSCQACPETGQAAAALRREDLLYDIKGGSLRSPPAPAAGGRKRPSSPAPARQGVGPRRRSARHARQRRNVSGVAPADGRVSTRSLRSGSACGP